MVEYRPEDLQNVKATYTLTHSPARDAASVMLYPVELDVCITPPTIVKVRTSESQLGDSRGSHCEEQMV